MAADMNSRTVEGLLAFLEYLKEKHFLAPNSVEGLRTSVKKVFEGVDGEDGATIDLTDLDLDAYLRRFQVAEGRHYKPDTIAVYGRRIKQAIEAQRHYVETGQVPMFKTGGARGQNGSTTPKAKRNRSREPGDGKDVGPPAVGDLVEFPFPLRTGQMARFHLPPQGLHPKDVDRASAFLRSLQFEEQRQIPERTGEEDIAA